MDLFQPDTILAPQFFATLRRQAPSKKGEWQLVVAVLEDAVYCFQKYFLARDNYGQRLFREAREWMMSPQPRGAPGDEDAPGFSFEYICEVIGLDPDYLRRGLERWREEQLAKALAQVLSHPGPAVSSGVHPGCFELPTATLTVGRTGTD
ncbi:MAG: hypothetical protein ACHQ9S_13515 [Candidatus Binatia bacterium]